MGSGCRIPPPSMVSGDRAKVGKLSKYLFFRPCLRPKYSRKPNRQCISNHVLPRARGTEYALFSLATVEETYWLTPGWAILFLMVKLAPQAGLHGTSGDGEFLGWTYVTVAQKKRRRNSKQRAFASTRVIVFLGENSAIIRPTRNLRSSSWRGCGTKKETPKQ